MKISSLFKYLIRFLTLQTLLSYLTIFYFNNYLIPRKDLTPNLEGFTFRDQINANLYEDYQRFYPFLDEKYVQLNYIIVFFIFTFLIFLYSTKFYTYVNELSFSLDRNYFDEYFSIYLTWTTSLIFFVTFFRLSNLISRGYLLFYTFLIPVVLIFFRNSELISSLFGRSVTNEKYITFNLKEDSIFKDLRIMTFRKIVESFNVKDINNSKNIIKKIDSLNKKININLIVLNFDKLNKIDEQLENYLINLNKKILIICKDEIEFNKLFLSRQVELKGFKLIYFNNDIQYGSKYILKRILDITLSLLLILFLSPLFIFIYLYIFFLDKTPIIIKQNRVGLHGKQFIMYKFRTMKNDSHKERENLKELSSKSGPLFKITNDPRLIKGTKSLRNYSLDELPQLLNVLKGDMSLVGPRPLFEEDTQHFNENYMRRLNVLPGLTGLLQINDRNTDEFSTWYKFDMEYIENWSLFLDLKIIFKTPFALFKTKNQGK
tara:strand:- start:217 stop:1683 length:1467 start_codon:yes stop_codon:yes gene_type:complete